MKVTAPYITMVAGMLKKPILVEALLDLLVLGRIFGYLVGTPFAQLWVARKELCFRLGPHL